jgi:hypothetical protein
LGSPQVEQTHPLLFIITRIIRLQCNWAELNSVPSRRPDIKQLILHSNTFLITMRSSIISVGTLLLLVGVAYSATIKDARQNGRKFFLNFKFLKHQGNVIVFH